MITKNWHDRIIDARDNGDFSGEDKDLALSWVTCACGGLDPMIPRYHNGPPEDPVLGNLGILFSECVETNSVDFAEAMLAKIQKRAAQLLAKVAKKRKKKS